MARDATAAYDPRVDDDATIRLRPLWRQLPWYLPIAALAPSVVSSRRDGAPSWPTVLTVVLVVVLVAETVFLKSRGADLRPDALVVRGLRTRVIPWHEVAWVGPAPLFGTQCVGIATTRYGMLRLRAPLHTPFLGPDPEFLAKARTIYEFWTERRRVT